MSEHLFNVWNNIEALLSKNNVMLFLDYDGTLTPIVEIPEAARLPDRTRKVLNELNVLGDVNLTIVSGRSLQQLKDFIGIPGLLYVGNHGFEIEGPGIEHTHPGALAAKELLDFISADLRQSFAQIPQVFVENKIFTLSIHYRQVPVDKIDRIKMIFLKVIQPYLDNALAVFTEGKKVLEVRPALGWNKGTAVTWLYGRALAAKPLHPLLPVYVGDDRTDEAPLKAMKNRGIGIKVAEDNQNSHADYYLKDPDEIYEFLSRVKRIKSGF